MTCPRCNNEWDVSKSPCPRCGLLVHLPERSRRTRSPMSPERGIPPTPQTPHITQNLQSSNMPFGRQQSGGMPPVRPQSKFGRQSNPMPSMRREENTVFPAQPNDAQMPMTPYPSRIPPMVQQTDPQRETMENARPSLPVKPQQDQYAGTPALPSVNPVPNTPYPANPLSPDYEYNPFLARLRRNDAQSETPMTRTSGGIVGSENAALRNVPHRPQAQPLVDRSTEDLLSDAQRSSIRPSRLITDSLSKKGRLSETPTPLSSGPTLASPKNVSPLVLPPLVPGTLLRGGRYRLRELQGRQDWLKGVFEATWIAQDAQRSGSQVMVCELVTPDSKSMVMQSTLRNATMALTSVGRHPHIPTLWDAFSDQGRNFFVFEPTEGESLVAHMRRTGRALPEQNVVECCLQMTELLELLAQQASPLVHGLIRPEYIIIGHAGSEYILTNFSIVLAGRATQYVAGIDRSHLTPYTSPEFVRGTIDGHADLYSLLATAYHAVTGSMPSISDGSIPQAQRLNPTVSSAFDAILAKGLHHNAIQRYQRPSELRQDLLAMRSVNGTLTSRSGPLANPERPKAERSASIQTTHAAQQPSTGDTLSQILPSMLASDTLDFQEQKLLLPRPEELAPMPQGNDALQAAFWLIGILICLIVIVIVSRGFM